MPGNSPYPPICSLAAAWLFLAGVLAAQSPAPGKAVSEVAGKRAAFEANVSSLLEPLNRKYAAALRKMEKELAIAKDYEAAIALRDQRLAVEAMLAKAGSPSVASTEAGGETGTPARVDTTASVGESDYSAAAAKALNGAEKRGDVVRLTEAGQAAEWAVTGLPAGGYEVMVTYSCAEASEFQVKEHFFRLSCEAPASGGAETVKTESFGTLKITSRATVVTLTVDSLAAGAPLIVHEMKLVSNRG